MHFSPQDRNRAWKAIVEGNFRLDFEDVCNNLLKRIPQYTSLRSGKLRPNIAAPSGAPDAYLYYEEEDKWIFFEYTTTDRSRIKNYLRKLVERDYILDNIDRIKEIVVVSSQSLRENIKVNCQVSVEEALNCRCRILDSEDLLNIFEEHASDLVEPLLGVEYHPKWFLSLEEAVDELNRRYVTFPSVADFERGEIYQDDRLIENALECIREHKGPTLVTGRWGTGKTVFAINLGFMLRENDGFSIYYLDLESHVGRDKRQVFNEIINKALIPFHHLHVLFIVDNAHVFPYVSYGLTEWAIKERANVLLIARPISMELCDEKQYFQGLFDYMITGEQCREGEAESEPKDYDGDETLSHEPLPHIVIRPDRNIKQWLINHRLQELGECDSSKVDLVAVERRIGNNLTLLILMLNHWHPERGSILETNMDPVYQTLENRFRMNEFPEIYLIAALNYFDCPVDMNVVFNTPEREASFVSAFFPEGGQRCGYLFRRRKRLFGIGAAEAWLICESGLRSHNAYLHDARSRVASSVDELLRILVVRYASRRPANPYEMLRYLRWGAAEAREFEGVQGEEAILNILKAVLSCDEFISFLKGVILIEKLSMLGLGNIARLTRNVGLSRHQYSELLSIDVLDEGVARFKQQWKLSNFGQDPWFTWREFFAWRHLSNLDVELGSHFLSQFSYEELRLHGSHSIRGLSNLFLMAARTNWLRSKVLRDLPDYFGKSDDFRKEFSKLRETSICFLVRHASLLSYEAANYLASLIPPDMMAQIIKGLTKIHGNVFGILNKHLSAKYCDDLLLHFDCDEVYRLLYRQGMDTISYALSDDLFQRFLQDDFSSELLETDLNSIQLFLRNVSLHGFKERHRKQLGKKFGDERLMKAVLKKIAKEQPPLSDLAFFLFNLETVDSQIAEKYAIAISQMELSGILNKGRLSDISLFYMSIWLAGSLPVSEIPEVDMLQNIVDSRAGESSISDMLTIGGIVRQFDIDFRAPWSPEKISERVGPYIARILSFFPESEDDRRSINRALRLALNIEGLAFFGWTPSQSAISEYVDKEHLLGILLRVKNYIERTTMTVFSGSLRRLPEATVRKIQLLDSAVLWLAK